MLEVADVRWNQIDGNNCFRFFLHNTGSGVVGPGHLRLVIRASQITSPGRVTERVTLKQSATHAWPIESGETATIPFLFLFGPWVSFHGVGAVDFIEFSGTVHPAVAEFIPASKGIFSGPRLERV